MNAIVIGSWLKLETISEYLASTTPPEYVLMVDADVVIHTVPNHDNIQVMIDTLAASGKSVMFGDESWGDHNAALRINGGVMFARNTPWAKAFFKNLTAPHPQGGRSELRCKNNEQLCLRDWYEKNIHSSQDGVLLASGKIWNRHPKIGMADGELIHFMGVAKSQLVRMVDVVAPGVCGAGGGIKNGGLCLNVAHCARGRVPRGSRRPGKLRSGRAASLTGGQTQQTLGTCTLTHSRTGLAISVMQMGAMGFPCGPAQATARGLILHVDTLPTVMRGSDPVLELTARAALRIPATVAKTRALRPAAHGPRSPMSRVHRCSLLH